MSVVSLLCENWNICTQKHLKPKTTRTSAIELPYKFLFLLDLEVSEENELVALLFCLLLKKFLLKISYNLLGTIKNKLYCLFLRISSLLQITLIGMVDWLFLKTISFWIRTNALLIIKVDDTSAGLHFDILLEPEDLLSSIGNKLFQKNVTKTMIHLILWIIPQNLLN